MDIRLNALLFGVAYLTYCLVLVNGHPITNKKAKMNTGNRKMLTPSSEEDDRTRIFEKYMIGEIQKNISSCIPGQLVITELRGETRYCECISGGVTRK